MTLDSCEKVRASPSPNLALMLVNVIDGWCPDHLLPKLSDRITIWISDYREFRESRAYVVNPSTVGRGGNN